MPSWAKDPADFWKAADTHERANAKVYMEYELALPNELTPEQRKTLVETFLNEHVASHQYPHSYAAKASFEIDAASVDSNHEARDKHLRSPDFLDVKQYPKMTFVSTGYEGTKDKGVLKGTLTLHGVSKDVAFDLVHIGEGKDPWGGYRSGFNATTTIKRSEFGVNYMVPNIPDEMTINLFVEGVRK